MATNLALDDRLVLQAKRLGHHRSKREAVNRALVDYVNRLKQREIIEIFGTVDWDSRYDHKASRRKRRS